MRLHPTPLSWLLLSFAACGSGGSDDAASGSSTGSVYVVIDTSTGTNAIVQFQVAAATLERADGATTGNVLREPELVTFADPSGELSGLQLRSVPSGDYEALHLVLVPGSGAVRFPTGSITPLAGPVVLEIPIADGLQHDATAVSWLAVGHNVGQTVVPAGQGLSWQPVLTARVDGSSHEVPDLDFVLQQGTTVTTTLPNARDGVLQLEFDDDCTFGDDDDGHEFDDLEAFLGSIDPDDDLRVSGELNRDGRCHASHARRGRGNDQPRLLGTVVELLPAETSFVMLVLAESRRGDRVLLDPPVEVLVLAAEARFGGHECHSTTGFESLNVGGIVKVKVESRTPVPGGRDEVVARRIEVFGANGAPLQPEWEGRVQSVDVAANTIVVVPRDDDHPILVNGQSVPQVEVVLRPGMLIERHGDDDDDEGEGEGEEDDGGEQTLITIDEVEPGERIRWRGTVTGPTTIAATRVRVQSEDDDD